MQRTLLAAFLSLAPASVAAAQAVDLQTLLASKGDPIPDGAPAGMAQIERAGLARHAFHLASDALGGRHTGTEGQFEAARYIAEQLKSFGLRPLGDEVDGKRDWFQRYPVRRTYLDSELTGLRLGTTDHATGFGVVPGNETEPVDVTGKLLFCGRGRSDDIPEKLEAGVVPVVVLQSKKPSGPVPTELQFMRGFRELAKLKGVASRVKRAGGEVLLLLDLDAGLGDIMQYTALSPQKPLLAFGSELGMGGMMAAMGGDRPSVPVVVAGAPLSAAVLAALKVVVAADGGVALTEPTAEVEARVRVAVKREAEFECWNVVAALDGSDPALAHEAVVFSAHMDHMGIRLDGDVFNGADDNASGSAGLLEIAQAFATNARPRRSVIFLSVSGEELGLWGSAYFAEHPTWPLAQIVADVNIDMIGRSTKLANEDEIAVTPSRAHRMFSTIVQSAEQLAPRFGLDLTNGDQFYERSDHFNFAERGVPVVFFCDGEHEDYHQVTDTADKLDYAKMERVARLAFWTGWEVAAADARPRTLGKEADPDAGEPDPSGDPDPVERPAPVTPPDQPR